MTPEELLEEWEEGEPGLRPVRVQEVRDDLMEYTGLTVPRRLSQIEVWIMAMKETGSVPRRLKEGSNGPSKKR
jgi:hypothetical protein